MTYASRSFRQLAHGVLVMLVVCVVALRTVAAPVVVGAAEDGVMTICAGGEIYYVTLDGTPVDAPGPTSDPCPYTGMTLALPDLAVPLSASVAAARPLGHPLPQALRIKAARARQNAPRAPPFPA
jgi:hypothetical protein